MFRQKSGAFINVRGKNYELVSNPMTEKTYLRKIKNNPEDVFYLNESICNNAETYITYDNAIKIRDWLTEMIEVVEDSKTEQKKEGNDMSKQYSFIEMLQEYENGYKGEFKKQIKQYII